MTRDEYDVLREKIRRFNAAYEAGQSEISDYEYDQLMLSLKAAEADHPEWRDELSPSVVVGAPVKRESGVTVEHDVPMLSIQDVFSKEDVLAFVRSVRERHPDALFSVEQKIDGLSMSLRYEHGRMVLAETRGDGYIGEDVTLNAAVIPDVAVELPSDPGSLELRGEVYMTFEDFDRTNARQERNGRKRARNLSQIPGTALRAR